MGFARKDSCRINEKGNYSIVEGVISLDIPEKAE